MVVTFRLDVDQFRRLLNVVMADDVADHLSNAILMACTRPHAGIISVPLPVSDGTALVSVLDHAASTDQSYDDLASLIRSQYATATSSDKNSSSS
jgi:hypothetical protein